MIAGLCHGLANYFFINSAWLVGHRQDFSGQIDASRADFWQAADCRLNIGRARSTGHACQGEVLRHLGQDQIITGRLDRCLQV